MQKLVVFMAVGLVLLAAALLTGCNDGNGEVLSLATNALVFERDNEATGETEVWLMAMDGSGKTRLGYRDQDYVFEGMLRPDGRKLLYMTRTQMVEQDLQTGVTTVLLTTTDSQMTPCYSPDGMKIAFTKDNHIYVMNVDGTNQVQLTDESDMLYDIYPAWNATGAKIIFDRQSNGGMWMMNADGSGETQVKAETETDKYEQPCFLPDGRLLCAQVAPSGFRDIVLMNADGTDEINLTPNTPDSSESEPTVNNTGTKIAFTRHAAGQADIVIGNFNGTTLTNQVNLTADTDDNCRAPRLGYVDYAYMD